MKVFIRELIISIILSVLLMFVLSIILSQTALSENLINPLTIAIVTFSLLIGAFRISKNKKEKGILYGALLGFIYMVILYLISSFANFEFSISLNSIIMIILGIVGGAIGGILGVNL
jgi:putative membrane protein (TIGR04086 family)